MRGIFTSLAITLGLLAPATQALASGIVYLGSDPTAHYTSFPQGLTLVQNAVTFAGGQSNPTMLLVGSGTGFGNTPSMLTAAGLSYTMPGGG